MLVFALATAWLCASVPVFAQESYYWCYAQKPDLSYFDHPPMVAWLIWLGTACFGDGAWGIRAGTWLCGLGATAVGAALLRAFGVDRVGVSAWIGLSLLSPILALTHFLANPDPMLTCGSAVVMNALWRARDGGLRWWLLAGTAAGCGGRRDAARRRLADGAPAPSAETVKAGRPGEHKPKSHSEAGA